MTIDPILSGHPRICTVTVRYRDGEEKQMPVLADQTILDAAEANGIPIVSECQSGICGTCVGQCMEGNYRMARAEGLSDQEKESGKILTCQTRVDSDCVITLEYPMTANAARLISGAALITRLERVSGNTVILSLDASGLPEQLRFKPGQFAQLRVPGSTAWRSYSYAHVPEKSNQLQFIIRMLPDGLMSNYLRSQARPGDSVQIRGSKGSFYLRPLTRPVMLMAGGTGLSAILAIAEQLAAEQVQQPVRLYYGVTDHLDVCKRQELEALYRRLPDFELKIIAANAPPDWQGPTGLITDLLDRNELYDGSVDVYLCGPDAMVDATRAWLRQHDLYRASLYYEKFTASGGSTVIPAQRPAPDSLDYPGIAQRGRGTAVVIGGSIAGMPAARILADRFSRVIVLEQDSNHDRKEARPGTAQGWHLHHLLIAGQKMLESIFPGITDDMVREGAFKVDTSHQYRILMAGSWKKVFKSGLEIVCAGRPLLEWCIRRRLDKEEKIDFRYDSKVEDLVYDRASNRVLGVVVGRAAGFEVIAAEFVVDASGKNTAVPEFLASNGVGAPETEQDCLNAFYSTMQHRVPPERRWRDKVMIICYAYRPFQQHYTAQYYIDSSRTVLSTSLVGYNCYAPPRNQEEFREFARLMPSSVIRDELEGLEACSPVYNFRYPNMLRRKYEKMTRLPRGLVAVGDAYCSADPVSGAGMTKALLEVNELRQLLLTCDPDDSKLVRNYYRRVSKIADRVWFVVREQNLRYPWIKDVQKKRPFYFGLLVWYIDRIMELVHDDADAYRQWLAVTHFVASPASLVSPRIAIKATTKWLASKLLQRKTLIERNFGPEGISEGKDMP